MLKYSQKAVLASCLLSGLFSLAATSAQAANGCSLGGTCRLKKGEELNFTVTPRSGTNYECVLTADRNSTEFGFGVGGDYLINNAPKYSVVDYYEATIDYKGHFRYQDNASQVGYLTFKHFGGDDASVTCRAIN